MKSVSVCTLLRVSETEQPAFNKHNVIFLVSFIDVGEFAAFFHQATHMGIIFTFLTEPYKIKTKQKKQPNPLIASLWNFQLYHRSGKVGKFRFSFDLFSKQKI